MRNIFQLQDELVDRIVQSLTLPLTAASTVRSNTTCLRARSPTNTICAPINSAAAGRRLANMSLARDLYLRCVDDDPQYAPAWACLGRIYRFLGEVCVEIKAGNFALPKTHFRRPSHSTRTWLLLTISILLSRPISGGRWTRWSAC